MGHYGAHRSGHHTAEASIPPSARSFDAPAASGPELLDLGAVHRDAVAALAEEGEVTVRVDDEVSVDVAVDGDAVHVVVDASDAAAGDLEGLQSELSEQLFHSGQELASYEHRSRGQADEERPSRGVRGEGAASSSCESAEADPVARGRLVNRIA